MTSQYRAGYLESLAPRILLGRLGDPQELSATAVWLVSDAAAYVNGQRIVVDGGVTIT
jgi:NAD(P)-dependent dehydrogenase (short-subunit alcohol dehydrogenase family)